MKVKKASLHNTSIIDVLKELQEAILADDKSKVSMLAQKAETLFSSLPNIIVYTLGIISIAVSSYLSKRKNRFPITFENNLK